MLEKTIEAIGTAIQSELVAHEGEIFKLLDRDEAVSIGVAINVEGKPSEIDLKIKLSYTVEKRVITYQEKISETQQDLFPQGHGVKAVEQQNDPKDNNPSNIPV